MYCLYCGDCCKTMSPLMEEDEHGNKKPCKHLKENSGFYYCTIYNQRPEQCRKHGFPDSKFCPIGLDVLGIREHPEIVNRVQFGEFHIESEDD